VTHNRNKGDQITNTRKIHRKRNNKIVDPELDLKNDEQNITKDLFDENDCSACSTDKLYERKVSVEEMFKTHTFGSLKDGHNCNSYAAGKSLH
jgi:hypothetical protein